MSMAPKKPGPSQMKKRRRKEAVSLKKENLPQKGKRF